MNIGCVGSRGLTPDQILLCEQIGEYLGSHGHLVVSGGALGADQAFVRGAHRGGGKILVCLPWATYERAQVPPGAATLVGSSPEEIALGRHCHPDWLRMRDSVRKLMARNATIVDHSGLIVAFPRLDTEGRWTGGTAHTLACAKARGVRIVDLTNAQDLARVLARISG